MIEKMISKLKQRLPFIIEGVSWDENILNIYGNGWSFATLSSWRVISKEKVSFGCYDTESSNQIFSIRNQKIIDITWQSTTLIIDPVFIFSNDLMLEIFSTDTYEPWTFSLTEELTYVACPSEPQLFIAPE